MRRRVKVLSAVVVLSLIVAACGDDADDDSPIVVGGSLALTGGLGPTGNIHRIAAEVFIERLNESGGLLGRPVEYNPIDDETDASRVTDIYEQLITEGNVDLLMGPYATPWIVPAMTVAENHGWVLPNHTSVFVPVMGYDCQFPGWSIGPEPNILIPNQLADALDTLDDVNTVALVGNNSGATGFVGWGRPDQNDESASTILPARGYEIVESLTYPPGHSDWGPLATAIRDADPDIVVMMALGVEQNALLDAMDLLNYEPPMLFTLFPASGAVLGLGDRAEGILSVTIFEPNESTLAAATQEVRDIVAAFREKASAASLFPVFETQAAASWNTWEILVQGVEGAQSLDQKEICDWLLENGANLTFGGGQVSFNPAVNNFWPTNQTIRQVQDGEWVVVWPAAGAAGTLRGPGN